MRASRPSTLTDDASCSGTVKLCFAPPGVNPRVCGQKTVHRSFYVLGGANVDILLVYGGRSAERRISLESAGFVAEVLDAAGHNLIRLEIGAKGEWTLDDGPVQLRALPESWKLAGQDGVVDFDLVFPVLHGPLGEDGTVQGLCEMAGWRYAGADVMTSSLAMNKVATKRMFEWRRLPVLPWITVRASRSLSTSELTGELSPPVFVKPARLGSSIGITRVDNLDRLEDALDHAYSYDCLLVVEKALDRAREIEVSVLGGPDGASASMPGEVLPGKEWYDYEAKYECEDSRLVIPADLSSDLASRLKTTAEKAFEVLGGTGFARVDFLLSPKGDLYVNEVNTIPGFTSISMFHRLWEASGIPPKRLMERIISEALTRRRIGRERPVGE
ncbi:D-alanine--D-alanine ligase [Candidatus Fermentibacteria bacterium]|nr:D-alanine--D-alanine ligase [Candidatus Fermentibacteria bacterium]